MEEARETPEHETAEAKVTGRGIKFSDARRMVESAESRDGKLRTYIASLRHLYRTGRLQHNFSERDLDRAMWERDDYRDDLEALNLACSYINIIVATTAARQPTFTAEPAFTSPDTTLASDAVAALIRTFLDEDDAISTARRVGLDASISGDGFGHVQWVYEEVPIPEEERQEMIEQARREYLADALEAGDVNGMEPPEGFEDEVPTSRVVKNRPTLKYVSPIDVLLPAHVSDVGEAPWYCIRSIQRIEDVRNNEAYDEEAVKQIGPERVETDDPARRLDIVRGNENDHEQVCTVYTFYDVVNHKMIVFTKGGGKPLYEGENPNDFNDICLVHLRSYRDGEHLRGFGDLELVAGLMDKLNEVVRQQLDNLERQGQIFVAKEDVLTDEDRANLESARAGDVVVARGLPEGVNLRDVIEAFPVTALSADVYNARNQLQEDIGKVLGLSDFQVGGLGPSRMSGTAAAVADGVATLRAQQRLEAYEQFYAQVANLFFKFCAQYLDEEQVVRIIGPDGSSWQETVDAEDLSEGYFIRVKAGSMASVNPSTRAQRGLELMGLADQLEAVGYDADTLRRFALREMGVDPELMGIRRQPPAPAPGPEAGGMPGLPPGPPQAGPPSLPPELGPAPDSTQADMYAAGGPPLPGAGGDLAL